MTAAVEPKHFRGTATFADSKLADRVERDGGQYGFGIIRGVSVITRGEALGHEMWIDSEFLGEVAAAIQDGGTKARFTHPGLSSDGVGTKLGRFYNATIAGDQVFADLHFQEAATKTPDGDLADYVMTLAEETPEDFGLSIAFDVDIDAMEQFKSDNTDEGIWISPDELNSNNFDHVRLHRLRAGDVVDSPAANPAGLFQEGQEAAQQGEKLAEYILGLTDDKPETSMFGVDADRAKQFFARFLSRHELSVKKGGDPVADDNGNAVDEPQVDVSEITNQFREGLQIFVSKFGSENGAAWYADGKSYAEALELHCDELSRKLEVRDAQLSELQEQLNSLALGDDPVAPGIDDEKEDKGDRRLSSKINILGRRSQN